MDILKKPKLVALTGAGMSAESGLKTFRDSGGLWEEFPIEEVATVEAWINNPAKVLHFYNLRRAQLAEVKPNKGHLILAELEKRFDVQVITQNVDDLHERAGSTQVLHLHGRLDMVKSLGPKEERKSVGYAPIHLGDVCADGHQLRPDIVWFGEEVPLLPEAATLVAKADILIIIGTSMQVYPAAGLYHYASPTCKIFSINPDEELRLDADGINYIQEPVTAGLQTFLETIKSVLD